MKQDSAWHSRRIFDNSIDCYRCVLSLLVPSTFSFLNKSGVHSISKLLIARVDMHILTCSFITSPTCTKLQTNVKSCVVCNISNTKYIKRLGKSTTTIIINRLSFSAFKHETRSEEERAASYISNVSLGGEMVNERKPDSNTLLRK